MSIQMHPIAKLERKALILTRILQTVEEYSTAFKQPCPLKVLSAKYSRSLMELGGLPEALNELKAAGTIEVWLVRSGSKVVCLPGFAVQDVNAVKL